MSSLFGKGQAKVIPEFTGLQVNTSVQVLPIPIIYGAPRININLIYYNGFHVVEKSSGGKGVLSGGKGSKQIQYYATLMMAIGEGPMGNTYIIYQDSNVFVPWDYPVTYAFYFNGTDDQGAWYTVNLLWPNDARGYKDTAYYAFYDALLDASATVPQIDLVVAGLKAGTSPLNNSTIVVTSGQRASDGTPIGYIGPIPLGTLDADPAEVIWDFLTNQRYGATFPPEWIDQDTVFTSFDGVIPTKGDAALSTYCQAVGFAWSVAINNVETASSIIERWCKNINVAVVWTGEVLRFIPYYDTYADANPGLDESSGYPKKYYQPFVQSLITLTMDDILQSSAKEDDPISFNRKDPVEVYNSVRVDFKDRHNFYNDVPAEAKDEAHIELYGPRVDNIGLANEFSLDVYAQTSATLQLRRNIAIMRTYTWKMSPLWGWLLPMDVITIPDPTDYSSTIDVRIISLEDDEDENVTITAEEFGASPGGATVSGRATTQEISRARASARSTTSFGAQSATILPMAPTTPPNQGAANNPPAAADPPIVIEPTADLQIALGYATPQFILGASSGPGGTLDPNWGGIDIWTSLDGDSYEKIGTLIGPSIMGYTTATLSAYGGTNPDMTDVVYVSLGESNGALDMSSPSAASAGHSICVIKDSSGYEVLSYTTATLTSPFTYALTGLYRGLYGTIPRGFNSGARFLYIGTNANVFIGSLPESYVGRNFWVKPQSFNVFYHIAEDLSDVTTYQYLVSGPTFGSALGISDNILVSDTFSTSNQRVSSLGDIVNTSDTFGASVSLLASLSDNLNYTDNTYTPTYHVTLVDGLVTSDALGP